MKQHMGCSLFGMVIVGLLLINTAQASTPVIWEQSSQRDFQKGNPSRILHSQSGLPDTLSLAGPFV